MIYLVDSRGVQVAIDSWIVILFISLVIAFTLGFYLLRSFGVYKLAKAQNMSYAYLAFIPGVWMYPACKLCGNARFFRSTIGRVAIYFTIFFTASVALSLVYNLVCYIPLVGYYLGGGEKIIISESVNIVGEYEYLSGVYMGSDFVMPYTSIGAYRLITTLRWISGIMRTAGEVSAIFMYFALFRKYWPEYSFVSAIFSLFGLFPIFVFLIRNKQPVDYEAFIRSRMNTYNNPYGNNPYGNNQGQSPKRPVDDPFESSNDDPFSNGAGKNSDDPFSDFDDKEN